jgi:hypothetical protein
LRAATAVADVRRRGNARIFFGGGEMKRSIPVVFGLLAMALSSTALAAPRGAASKIMGNFTQFDTSRRASQGTVQRNVMPQTFERTQTAAVPSNSTRRFSYEPGTSTMRQPDNCQPVTTSRAPSTRRFSYEPEAATTAPVFRQQTTPRSSGFSPVRDAGSKIRGDF